jgi:hypothetical protein
VRKCILYDFSILCGIEVNQCIRNKIMTKMHGMYYITHDKWVPVTTAWRVLRLRMQEWPPIWRVAANKLNKQSRTSDKEWSSSLGVGRGANNSSP